MPLEMIAAAIVSKYLLPALQEGAGKIVDAVSDKFDEQAAEHADSLIGRLWAKIDSLFGGSEGEKTTLEQFKSDPDVYEGAVTKLLQRKIDENPALATELQAMVDEKVPGTSMTGAQIWNAGVAGVVDLRQANFTGAQGMTFTGAVAGDSAINPPPAAPPSDASTTG